MIGKVLLAGALLVVAACRPAQPSIPILSPAPPVGITIYAAASLKAPLAAIQTAYESVAPGVTLTISTGSSAALRTQIEQGAPADVFLSADTRNPQALVEAALGVSPALPFAGNVLTIVVPRDNPAGTTRPFDLARPGLAIVAAGDEVPITRYARQLVANLAALPGAPAGFEAAYAANIVSREESVQAIVAKVVLGEGDAGIVYVTDALGEPRVRALDVPPEANVPATYAGVVIAASSHRDAAAAFLGWLAGTEGQAILAGFGFLPPP